MKRRFNIFLFLLISLLIWSCQPAQPSQPSTVPNSTPAATAEQLYVRNCKSCHGPGSLSAPQLAEIRKVYAEGADEAGFRTAMTSFLQNPSKENSKQPNWVEKYGPMPKLGIPDSDLQQIVQYIYDQKAEEATISTKNPDGSINYLMQGKEFAMKTKAILSKNLLGAIDSKGTKGAVAFCNTKAFPLTDSMAKALDVKIKRVSDQARNPQNKANALEKEVILDMKMEMDKGGEAKPQGKDHPDKFIGYYPIATNKMCLQCHGKMDSDIQAEVMAQITQLYPNDIATGYQENQLRGIWVVEMKK